MYITDVYGLEIVGREPPFVVVEQNGFSFMVLETAFDYQVVPHQDLENQWYDWLIEYSGFFRKDQGVQMAHEVLEGMLSGSPS